MAMEERRESRMMAPEERMGAEGRSNIRRFARAEYAPAWQFRISWGSVLAGVLVAIALQLVLSSLGILVGFGLTQATNVADLTDISTGLGIWMAVSALISLFVGAYVASRVDDTQFSSDGLWHGLTVWALALVGSVLLGSMGVAGLLDFAATPVRVIGSVIPAGGTVTSTDLQTAADIATTMAGYFIVGAVLALGAALLGGWLGSRRLNRANMLREEIAGERRTA